jgi:hypothetical protein
MDFRKIFLVSGIIASALFLTTCFRGKVQQDPRGLAYAGSATCMHCHKSIASSYTHTGHFLSTRLADDHSVTGSFSKDSNELYINDTTRLVMEKRKAGLYQVLYENNKEISAQPFDLAMGAVKGQTYLYWKDKGYFQLPVSYSFGLHQWTSSPGYSFSRLNFNRPVAKECFNCHSSYVSENSSGPSSFDAQKSSSVFNIDCERCHGPAAAHVLFHETHPEEKKSAYMVSFQSLNREQKIDLCAVCHSGTKHILLKSTFGFKMGDSLSSFMIALYTGDELDVHGNQTQLLSQSKCFRIGKLDCSTCHNTHINERLFENNFNERCQHCHSPGQHFCGQATVSNTAFLQNNCTNCHMPAQASKAIVVQTAGNTQVIPTMVVNHRIAIYPEATAIIMKKIKL